MSVAPERASSSAAAAATLAPPPWPRLSARAALVFGVGYVLAIALGHGLRVPGEAVGSPLWPPSGVYLAALVLTRARVWPALAAIAAAGFVGFYALFDTTPIAASIGYWATNTAAALLGAIVIHLLLGRPLNPSRRRDVFVLCGVGLVLPPTARLGTLLLDLGERADAIATHERVWQVWWLGDLLGILTVGGAILAWAARHAADADEHVGPRRHAHAAGHSYTAVLALALSAIVLAAGIFLWSSKPVGSIVGPPTLMFPLLIWAALQFGALGASLGGLILSLLLITASHAGLGPFATLFDAPRITTTVWIELALVVGTGVALALAAAIAERNALEHRLERQREDLANADKMVSLGTLVASVAHEINSPTQLLLMNLPALEAAWDDAVEVLEERYRADPDLRLGNAAYAAVRDDVRQLLTDTRGAADRVRDIVAELRGYSRIGARQTKPFDLDDVVHGALTLLGARIRRATRSFDLALERNLPRVVGDVRRMEQVVVNLVLNGCDALPSRDRALTVRTTRGDDGQVLLTIRDEGRGMTDEELRLATQPFFTTKPDGNGLGLAVSAQIVAEHGGTLEFDSVLGEGTTVTVSLPPAAEPAARQ